jgi:ABC-type Fe3+-hydroxamate transport system substrate-binding protein
MNSVKLFFWCISVLNKSIFRTSLKKSVLIFGAIFIFISSYSQEVKRVISLAPSITENIYLIGAQDELVGCTSYCIQAIADGVEQVGSTVDINVEKILLLKPDLVLTMEMTKAQDIAALRKLGIKVEVIKTPVNFEEICEQTQLIGALLGVKNSAQKILSETKNEVDSLKQICMNIPKKKIFFQIGADPVFTVLPNTFMNDFITFCNGENIASNMTKGTMTRESVIAKNPDIIIIATMGGFGVQEKKKWDSYSGLKAAEQKKIFLIDSETSCSPTPDNFAKAFADVVGFITGK